MESEKQQKQSTTPPGWAIALIVLAGLALLGTLAYFFYFKKARGNVNVGAPAPAANVAPPAPPSMTNVSSGNMGATGGNARATAPIAR